MAIKQKTSSSNYFSNLRTADANFSGGAPVNVFNATAKGARSTGISLGPKGPTLAEKEKAQSDATVAYNLENSPQIDWSRFENIPNDLQYSIMSMVKDKGAERGYLTHLTKRSGATDFIGKSEIASQISANEDLIIRKIPGQLEKFSAILDGFPEDAYNNNFSVMNNPEDVTFNSNLSAGKGEYSIDENGNILVNGKSVNEIKPLEPINYEMGGQMLKTFTSAYDNGIALSKNELGLASTNFTMALNKGGTGALLSTAFDDVMSMNGTLLNKDDYQNEIAAIRGDDPDAKMQAIEKIKLAVKDAYLERLTQQGIDGEKFKQSKNNPETKTESKFGKRIDDAVNSGGEFIIPVGSKNFQVIEYPKGSGAYKLYTGNSTYPYFDYGNATRNIRTLSSDPIKRKQQILEAVTGDISQGFEWSTLETDWSSAPESNVPFIGPKPPNK